MAICLVGMFLMALSLVDIVTTGGENMRQFVAYLAE